MRLSHIGWNLAGLSLPLLIAVVTVPPLIARLGNERFGLLALAWGLVGYAGALDLGIGRALTQWVARLRGEGNLSTVGPILMTANRITLIAGLVGAVLIATAALSGLGSWVKADTILPSEIQYAMLLLAIALPAQAMSSTYRGVNEAFLNFKGVSLLRVGLGVVGFGGPYLVSFFTIDLAWLVATLVVSRLMASAVYRWLALSCLKANHVALVHAKGRADVTAKLHVLELPLFLTALFYMLHTFGIAGAAWAWVGRMVFDAIALAWCAKAACSK